MPRSKHHREDQPDSEWRHKSHTHRYRATGALFTPETTPTKEERAKKGKAWLERQQVITPKEPGFFARLFKQRKVG